MLVENWQSKMLNEFGVMKLFFCSSPVVSIHCLDLNVKCVWSRRFLHFLSLPHFRFYADGGVGDGVTFDFLKAFQTLFKKQKLKFFRLND